MERVSGTEYTYILRVPFRTEKGILGKWISRFDIWPYLEAFTADAASEIAAELHGVPDLLIGNYSDGNLVASLLSNKLGVTQVRNLELCLKSTPSEKTKYKRDHIVREKLMKTGSIEFHSNSNIHIYKLAGIVPGSCLTLPCWTNSFLI
ncbi:putative sucrose synthase [Helianthus annuus]|nr:putative sucrose synthase [Helianthus annuus]